MKFKTNLVIGIVFAALLTFVYLYEIKGGEERRQAAEQSKKMLDFNVSEVTQLVVLNGEERIEISREENDWVMLSPVQDEADSEAVDRYLRNLNESEREKTVVDSAEALAPGVFGEYGLESPRLSVFVETKQGPLDTLLFGIDAPTDRFTYVRTTGPNPKIDVVRAWRYDNLEKTPFDLRNRKLSNLSQNDVTAIRRVSVDAKDIVLAKSVSSWQLKAPIMASADRDSVEALLGNIQNAEIIEFVNENPNTNDLEQYGLTIDQATRLDFVAKDIDAEGDLFSGTFDEIDVLFIGRRDKDGRYFARNPERTSVFLVDSTLVQQLQFSVFDLRDKTPIRFSRDHVTNIQIKRNGAFGFEVSKDTAGVWILKKPAEEPAKSWKVNALLTDLLDLRTLSFTEVQQGESILDIYLNGENGIVAELKFSISDGEIFLETPESLEAYRIDLDSFADIDLDVDDVRQEATLVDTVSTR
ncbi:MAG: DUF4340 domain-containing protein [Candidatus Latescibacterota bacterium]|nr:DUF4340 domain-containing protein [Candidatus Latescibacterota bacterium]